MRQTRLAGLDVLRAIAVLLVIGRHAAPLPVDSAAWLKAPMDLWARGGWVGVDLFFVLSGFLISGLLFAEHAAHGRIHYGRFLLRRGFKIYPPFWVLIAATAVLWHLAGHTPTAGQFAAELLYVQNYWQGYLPHSWSLAVEEHFYLALPLALLGLGRLHRGNGAFAALPFLVFWVAVLCLSLRCLHAAGQDHFLHQQHLFPTHLRIDSLLFGVLLSWLWHCRGLGGLRLRDGTRAGLGLLGIALLVPAFVQPVETSWFLVTFGVALFYLGSGLLLLAALGMRSRGPLVRGLARVGAHSYSIYLWHIPVRIVGDRVLEGLPPLLTFAVYFTGSLALGMVMSRLVEIPVLRFRDRVFPSRAQTPAVIDASEDGGTAAVVADAPAPDARAAAPGERILTEVEPRAEAATPEATTAR